MNKEKIAAALKLTLADTYAVYMKTHGYHWNVTGPQFHSLHTMFEEQYTEMWQALDEIAERVRALQEFAPGSGKALAALSDIAEETGDVPKANDMLKTLTADHEVLIERARIGLALASEEGDDPTADLLTQRIQLHEKTVWMLRSSAA